MKRIPSKLQSWFEARRRFELSHAHVQMARELGMNPKKFGSLANENQEPWKAPLREFIAQCYFKSFGSSEPEHVRSLEQLIEADEVRRKRKFMESLMRTRAPALLEHVWPNPTPHADAREASRLAHASWARAGGRER